MTDIYAIEEYAAGLLLIATFVGILARRSRMPYTVGLVVVGAGIAIIFNEMQVHLQSEVILGIFVPPLIFEAAFHLPITDLRRNLRAILILAITGVLLTTFLVGWIVTLGTSLEVGYAILFGSIIAATDPIAVIALFKTLGVPKRLQVLLEGESLLNDGTAIVIFNIAIAAVTTGAFSIREGISDFVVNAGVGVGIGFVLGILASVVISRIDDYLIETTITFILAYGTFVIAESIHVSGVLAVLTAGIIIGNVESNQMSPTTRVVVYNFWEFMAFIANSFVFLLIGLVTDISLVFSNWQAIVWGIFAALIARLIVIYGLLKPFASISTKWKHILYWGGLRGAISLALVLSLSSKINEQVSKQLLAMVFGLVVFTLLVQGTSMNSIIKKLKIVTLRKDREEYDLRRARAISAKAGYEHLERVHKNGMISKHVWEILSNTLDQYSKRLNSDVREILKQHPDVETEEMDSAWREFLNYQRLKLSELFASKAISEEVFTELTRKIDAALDQNAIRWSDIEHLTEIFLEKKTAE